MRLWTTVAVALLTGLIYMTTRFHASRKEFRKLQRANLVSQPADAIALRPTLIVFALSSLCLTGTRFSGTCSS